MTPENLGLIKYTEDDGLNYLSNEDWESFTQDVSEYLNISLDKKKKVEQLQ